MSTPQTVRQEALTVLRVTPDDCVEVAGILAPYTSQEALLWRTPADIEAHRSDFLIARLEGEAAGCVAVRDYGEGLHEVRSLAVRQDLQDSGIGSALMTAATELAASRGATRLFALTRRPEFFTNRGFVRVEKEDFPQKVWTDCKLCFKEHRCDEVAVSRHLDS